MLKEAPDLDFNSGWQSLKHFLIRGALAVVKTIDCGPKGFSIQVEFNDESWIKEDFATKTKEVVPMAPDRKHLYGFSDTVFVKV
jgi:hypothetical protein